MERIKEALNAARAERDRRISDSEVINGVARRLRLFANFEHLGEDARRAVVAAGEVLDIDSGNAICILGERDERVNFLLEGMVRIETADGSTRDLHAGDGPARHALDEPGYKVAGIVATHPCRVFRIDPARLPGTSEAGASTPAPTHAYADTFSGQQLAMLVGALRNEHRGLNGVASAPNNTVEVAVGDRTLGLDIPIPDMESTRHPPLQRDEPEAVAVSPNAPPAPAAAATPDAPLLVMTRTFEAELRRYVDGIREQERQRAQAKLKAYAEKLKTQAEEQLRNRVKAVKARFEDANASREADIRRRYEQLLELANRLTRQKAEINQARQRIEEKLGRAEALHRELAELGGVVSSHLDQIDGMLPADEDQFQHELAAVEASPSEPSASPSPVAPVVSH